ncbi:MAG TPA: TIGR01458 family HAD-type hydrolase [Candidatus Angelobacter sp.]|nr:TIGR01458 family HAD-type hydrolase [Candidatus Angelobacter sp.]
MTAYRGALLDLDGVLYVGQDPLPGATAALAQLRAAGLRLGFVTNTTRRSRRVIRADLAAMGFVIADDELFTPARAAREWIGAHGVSPYLLIHPGLAEDFAGLPQDGKDAVVVGDAGDGFTYAALNQAFRLLILGAPLLALAANRYFREAAGLSLDAGPFVTALEHASGTRALLFGKPAPEFFRAAIDSFGCPSSEVVVIGDDFDTDVNGAIAVGLAGILVRTGKYRLEDEQHLDRRAAVVDDIVAAVDHVLS